MTLSLASSHDSLSCLVTRICLLPRQMTLVRRGTCLVTLLPHHMTLSLVASHVSLSFAISLSVLPLLVLSCLLSFSLSSQKCLLTLFFATHCNTLQHSATHCNTRDALQHTAALCDTLQHTATHAATHCTRNYRLLYSREGGHIHMSRRGGRGARTH